MRQIWFSISANTPANPSKSRKRYILIHPKNGGALCPNLLTEIKVCLDLPVCNQYQWNVSDWSECLLHRQEKCGRGLKARSKDWFLYWFVMHWFIIHLVIICWKKIWWEIFFSWLLFKEVLINYVDNRFFYMDIMTLEENEIKLC